MRNNSKGLRGREWQINQERGVEEKVKNIDTSHLMIGSKEPNVNLESF